MIRQDFEFGVPRFPGQLDLSHIIGKVVKLLQTTRDFQSTVAF